MAEPAFPATRLRRLRRTSRLRSLVRETRLDLGDFVMPLFVCPGEGIVQPLEGLPGIAQRSVDAVVEEIEAQARAFVKAGMKPLDALHLASASWAKAAYFCTCDDKLLKKGKKLKSLETKVVSPLELIAEVTP